MGSSQFRACHSLHHEYDIRREFDRQMKDVLPPKGKCRTYSLDLLDRDDNVEACIYMAALRRISSASEDITISSYVLTTHDTDSLEVKICRK